MALLRNFCCCFHVRSGSVFTGVYSLITSAIFVCLLIIRYVGFRILETSSEYSLAVYVTICIFGLQLLSAVLLIVGVTLDSKMMILPWIVVAIVSIFEGAGVLCWFLVSHIRTSGDIPSWEAGITTFHLCNSIILVYCLLCVISQLQDLVAGKGTARDYRRRRQRRTRHRIRNHGFSNSFIHNTYLPEFDFEDPHPVATPPPYTSDKPPPYRQSDSVNSGDHSIASISNGRVGGSRIPNQTSNAGDGSINDHGTSRLGGNNSSGIRGGHNVHGVIPVGNEVPSTSGNMRNNNVAGTSHTDNKGVHNNTFEDDEEDGTTIYLSSDDESSLEGDFGGLNPSDFNPVARNRDLINSLEISSDNSNVRNNLGKFPKPHTNDFNAKINNSRTQANTRNNHHSVGISTRNHDVQTETKAKEIVVISAEKRKSKRNDNKDNNYSVNDGKNNSSSCKGKSKKIRHTDNSNCVDRVRVVSHNKNIKIVTEKVPDLTGKFERLTHNTHNTVTSRLTKPHFAAGAKDPVMSTNIIEQTRF